MIKNEKRKIYIYRINYSKFTIGNDIKIKCKIDGKINFLSYCLDGCFKKFEEELNDLLKILKYM